MMDMNSRFKREIVSAEPVNQDPVVPTTIRVNLDQLEPYDKNPRQSENPKKAENKESIRHRGLDHPPNITRRPGSDKYMIRDGGNTRLQILNELWEETGDQQFFEIDCRFYPWEGDLHALAGHMVENEQRGGMLFIERAIAAKELEALILKKDGVGEISQRQLAKRITAEGWTLSQGNLSVMMYAESELYPHIPDAFWGGLGRPAVNQIRKLQRACETYWLSLEPDDQEGFERVFSGCLSEADHEDFDFGELEQLLYSRLGAALQVKGMGVVAAEISAILAGAQPSGRRGVQALPPRSPETSVPPIGRGTPPMGGAPATTTGSAGLTGSTGQATSDVGATHQGVTEPESQPPEHGATPRQSPTVTPSNPTSPVTESPLDMPDLPGLRQRAFELAWRLASILSIENSVIPTSAIEGLHDGWGFTLEYPDVTHVSGEPKIARLGVWTYLLSLRYVHRSPESHLSPNQVLEHVFREKAGLAMAAGCWSIKMRQENDEMRALMDELEAVIRTLSLQQE